MSHNTISFRLWSVISFAYSSISEEDCCALRVRTHEVREVATFLLFKKNCLVHQVLKAGTWSAQLTFSFYLRDVTHRHLDIFSIGPVVAAQQFVQLTNPFGSGVVILHIGLSWQLYLRLSFFSLQTKVVTEALHQRVFGRYMIGTLITSPIHLIWQW